MVKNISHNVWESGGNNNEPGIINTDISLSTGTYYLKVTAVNKSAKYVMTLKNKVIQKPVLKSAKNIKGRKVKVKLSSMINEATGYQVRYGIKSSMKGAKKAKINDKYTIEKIIKNLKRKKKYYIQVRTYLIVEGITCYSNWSNKKSVKIKK